MLTVIENEVVIRPVLSALCTLPELKLSYQSILQIRKLRLKVLSTAQSHTVSDG